MTLLEMSLQYEESAALLRGRMKALQGAERTLQGEEARRLRQRIQALAPLLREARELAALTAHYYDRSYHNNERYTF